MLILIHSVRLTYKFYSLKHFHQIKEVKLDLTKYYTMMYFLLHLLKVRLPVISKTAHTGEQTSYQ